MSILVHVWRFVTAAVLGWLAYIIASGEEPWIIGLNVYSAALAVTLLVVMERNKS